MSFAAALPWKSHSPPDRSLGHDAKRLRREFNEVAAALARSRLSSEMASRLHEAVVGYGPSVSYITFFKTVEFLDSLPPELPLPIVVVESDDEIGLDWDEDPLRVVSLTIDSSEQIGFAGLFGREPLYGRVDYIDGLPRTLRFLLARLYPSIQLS